MSVGLKIILVKCLLYYYFSHSHGPATYKKKNLCSVLVGACPIFNFCTAHIYIWQLSVTPMKYNFEKK